MQHNDNNELRHYGVPGMKWGVRRSMYKLRSADSLRKGKRKIENDIAKAKNKANKQAAKAAKVGLKASKYMSKGDSEKASKYFKKSYKKQKRFT